MQVALNGASEAAGPPPGGSLQMREIEREKKRCESWMGEKEWVVCCARGCKQYARGYTT